MARLPRIVLAGAPHHVVQRGHNRQPIVTDDEDRRMWLATLRDAAVTLGVEVHAWALRDDRFHLVVTPPSPTAVSRLMQTVGRRYVGWFNRRHGRTGTLWEGRFRASVLEPARWLLACMRYVELQPGERAWSSLPHHLGQQADTVVTDHPAYWALGNTPFERQAAYRGYIDTGLPAGEARTIAATTARGWPLGAPDFSATGGLVMHETSPRPRGRPRKHTLTLQR
jgi:putative transposase